MCGIAGIILKSNASDTDLTPKLRAMARAMAHRGPDDEGIFVSPNNCVGLANRRLAIRDLSPSGHMPMANDAEDVVITYNGEIYNADELRIELEGYGYRFRSRTDTEVILRGYERWGVDIIPQLRGMFAFAIYDFRQRNSENPKIVIARDHMGIKPIYYYQSTDIIVFASELKGLFACGLVTQEIDPAGLIGYLLTGSVPNPLTIYRGVSSLEPSNYLVIDTSTSLSLQRHCYWSLPTEASEVSSIEQAVEICRDLLGDAVRRRLVSDVPLGAFLSGGLDSSAVVALMRQATNGTIRTCSMVFEESEYSEAHYARSVADAVGSEHFERIITFDNVAREFDNILYAMDQPSVDGVNTYFVSQTARQAGLTVALSGLGGDELFGGYPNTFREVPRVYRALRLVQRIPAGTAAAHAAIQALPDKARWGRVLDALERPASLASAYMTRRGVFSPNEVRRLVSPALWEDASSRFDLVGSVSVQAGQNGHGVSDEFAWVSRAELRNYTHHQLLRDTDVMSMAHSLEVRVPLLDRQLVSTVLGIPSWVKQINSHQPKPLLVHAMRGLLPDLILDRQDKQGFTFPFAVWLRGGLADKTRGAIAKAVDAGIVQANMTYELLEQFNRGRIHWSRIWSLAALSSISSVTR